jgi:hypothetical protein
MMNDNRFKNRDAKIYSNYGTKKFSLKKRGKVGGPCDDNDF